MAGDRGTAREKIAQHPETRETKRAVSPCEKRLTALIVSSESYIIFARTLAMKTERIVTEVKPEMT